MTADIVYAIYYWRKRNKKRQSDTKQITIQVEFHGFFYVKIMITFQDGPFH